MKGGGEYSLKGTRGLAERKGLKRERKREVDVMKWDKEKKKKHDRETNWQTSRMKDTASLLACTEIYEHVLCFLYFLETDFSSVWAGIRCPERCEGEARAAVTPDLAGTLASLKYQTHTLSLVCLSAFLFSSSVHHHSNTPFSCLQPKAEISRPPCSLALSLSLLPTSDFCFFRLSMLLSATLCFLQKVTRGQIVFHNEADQLLFYHSVLRHRACTANTLQCRARIRNSVVQCVTLLPHPASDWDPPVTSVSELMKPHYCQCSVRQSDLLLIWFLLVVACNQLIFTKIIFFRRLDWILIQKTDGWKQWLSCEMSLEEFLFPYTAW